MHSDAGNISNERRLFGVGAGREWTLPCDLSDVRDKETTMTTTVGGPTPITPGRATRLRAYNLGLGSLHALQGVLVLALSTDFSLPVTASFLAGPPGTPPAAPMELFRVSVGPAVAAFLFLSAAAHWIIAPPATSPRT